MRQAGVYTEGRYVSRSGTRKEICCLTAGVQARRIPGRMQAGPKSSIQPIDGPRGVRQCPIEQDFRGCNAHECIQHPGATAHSWCERKAVKTVPYRFNAARARAGARSRGVEASRLEREQMDHSVV